MKKLILLALTAVMMAGCETRTSRVYPETGSTNELRDGFVTYTAGECEYWIYQNHNGGIPIHKGNCKYCTARRQKELEELVIKLKEK